LAAIWSIIFWHVIGWAVSARTLAAASKALSFFSRGSAGVFRCHLGLADTGAGSTEVTGRVCVCVSSSAACAGSALASSGVGDAGSAATGSVVAARLGDGSPGTSRWFSSAIPSRNSIGLLASESRRQVTCSPSSHWIFTETALAQTMRPSMRSSVQRTRLPILSACGLVLGLVAIFFLLLMACLRIRIP
jgi:hypothetical protein